MTSTAGAPARSIGYSQARRLIILGGLIVLLATAGVMYVRRVDTVEVGAVLLFIPVFLAFVMWDVRGGLVAGVLATIAYVALRYPAIDAVGASRFTGLIISRGLAYVAFGVVGGWADRSLEASLEKLDLYDQIDDQTGLNNARFFVQDTDLELARAQRYQTLFSVVLVDVPTATFDSLPRRRRDGIIRDLGRLLGDSVRNVDRAMHAHDRERHRFAVVLPETGPEGAGVFRDRLAERVAGFLSQRGAPLPAEGFEARSITLPGEEDALHALRDEFASLDRQEHPEHPV